MYPLIQFHSILFKNDRNEQLFLYELKMICDKLQQHTSHFSCASHTILRSSPICCKLGESNSSTGIWWNFNSVAV